MFKKMHMSTTQVLKLFVIQPSFVHYHFCGPHTEPHVVRGLRKNVLDYILGQGICEMRLIPCACVDCTSMLEKTWSTGISHYEQPHYHPVLDCTYWPVLGYFKTYNMIIFTNKSTSSEHFGDIHKIILEGISDKMEYLVKKVKCGPINTTDKKGILCY